MRVELLALLSSLAVVGQEQPQQVLALVLVALAHLLVLVLVLALQAWRGRRILWFCFWCLRLSPTSCCDCSQIIHFYVGCLLLIDHLGNDRQLRWVLDSQQ